MFMIHLKRVNNLNIKLAHMTFRCHMIFVIPQITFYLTSQQVLSSIYILQISETVLISYYQGHIQYKHIEHRLYILKLKKKFTKERLNNQSF